MSNPTTDNVLRAVDVADGILKGIGTALDDAFDPEPAPDIEEIVELQMRLRPAIYKIVKAWLGDRAGQVRGTAK